MKVNLQKQLINSFALLLIFIIVCFYIYANLYHLNHFLSQQGWSIKNFIDLIRYPKLFEKNFSDAQNANLASFYIQWYLYLSYLKIPSEWLDYVSVIVNALLYVSIPIVLLRFFKPKASLPVYLVLIALTIASAVRLCGLGNWGMGIIGQSPYAAAYFFSIVGVILLYKERIILSAIAISLSVLCHPMLGMIGAFFALCSSLPVFRRYFLFRTLVAIILFIVIVGLWEWSFLPYMASKEVPLTAWLNIGWTFNYHWFPVTHGFLWSNSSSKLMPFLAFILLLFNYLKKDITNNEVNVRFFCGSLGLLFLTVLGLVFSISHYPFLIKLALQRSSSLLLLLGLVYVGYGLWQDIVKGNLLLRVFAGFALLTVFFTQGGFAVFPALLVVIFGGSLFNKNSLSITIALYVAFLLIIALSLIYYFANVTNIFTSDAYLGVAALKQLFYWKNTHFLNTPYYRAHDRHYYLAVILATHVGYLLLLTLIFVKRFRALQFLLMLAIAFASYHFIWQNNNISSSNKQWQTYKNYYYVQLWAKHNTSPGTLFMIPPGHAYGWSDYSMRPYLGTLYLWLYSWMYVSDYSIYQKGQQIFTNFGIPLEPYLAYQDTHGYDLLHKKINAVYYSKGRSWFTMMAKKYGIGYFVLNKSNLSYKKDIEQHLPCQLVYQNNNYIVCKPYS